MENLKYKIPNKAEYPDVIEAVYQLFIQGIFHIAIPDFVKYFGIFRETKTLLPCTVHPGGWTVTGPDCKPTFAFII